MGQYQRHCKNILKQYGKNLKAAEKRAGLTSNWKGVWQDYKQLKEDANGNF